MQNEKEFQYKMHTRNQFYTQSTFARSSIQHKLTIHNIRPDKTVNKVATKYEKLASTHRYH